MYRVPAQSCSPSTQPRQQNSPSPTGSYATHAQPLRPVLIKITISPTRFVSRSCSSLASGSQPPRIVS